MTNLSSFGGEDTIDIIPEVLPDNFLNLPLSITVFVNITTEVVSTFLPLDIIVFSQLLGGFGKPVHNFYIE